MGHVFVIEHMEPELSEWCSLEYQHCSDFLGKDNLTITNLSEADQEKLKAYATVTGNKAAEQQWDKPCILDPYAPDTLKPEDSQEFSTFIFGGILGNNPAERRTEKLTAQFQDAPRRNLGEKQLSTDTALYVTKKILDGTPLHKIHFVNEVEIEVDEGESFILPFPYVVEGTKPIISDKLVEHLKEHEGF